MNKLYLVTALTLASICFASAEGGVKNQTQIKTRSATIRPLSSNEGRPQIAMLNSNVGLQIRALNKEMEDKIQVIRSEYMAKIKVILEANKMATSTASTTPRGVRGGMHQADEGEFLVPPANGTSTSTSTPLTAPVRTEENGKVSTEKRGGDLQSQVGQDIGLHFRNFFRGFFGGNN